MPEHYVSPPYGVSMSQMTPSAPHSHRYIRGASQQQQPHKSNSSGRVKPLTPLLARRKRMPSLKFSPVSGLQPGCEDREFTLHKAMPHRRCFDHHHKTLLFNRSPNHFPLRHATLAIHAMRLMSIDTQPLSSCVSEKGVKQKNKFSAAKQMYSVHTNLSDKHFSSAVCDKRA